MAVIADNKSRLIVLALCQYKFNIKKLMWEFNQKTVILCIQIMSIMSFNKMIRFFAALVGVIVLYGCQGGKAEKSAEVFLPEGKADTVLFKQAPFEWHITPRYDYSKVFVTKLFLCQAEFDKEYLGAYKMRDNGQSTVYMTCEQALEAIKGMDAVSPGLQKIVYLVGWQYNGHDSKYPAFFGGNESIKRPGDDDPLDSVRWLMREAKKYNTAVSLHINMFDAFEDSPAFQKYKEADVLAREKDGSYIFGDWGYKVSYAAEWEKGLSKWRIDSLCSLLPIQEAGTIHIDAFHNKVPRPRLENGKPVIRMESPISPWHGHTAEQDQEGKENIVKYLDSKGIDVTTEGAEMGMGKITDGWFPMFWHYNSLDKAMSLTASQACGGNIYGNIRAFGRSINGEAIFRDSPSVEEGIARFKNEFCKRTLITLYLNTFARKALVTDESGSAFGIFENGVRTQMKDNILTVAKDGEILSDEKDVFIPALWIGNSSVIAFSENGYDERTWTVPEGVKLSGRAKGWILDASGRKEFKNFEVKRGKVTLSLDPGEMVLITD